MQEPGATGLNPNAASITIDTDADTLALWDRARAVNPNAIAWARVVNAKPVKTGGVCVTISIAHDHYEATLDGMNGVTGHVPGAIEAELNVLASEIVEADDIVRDIADIPIHTGDAKFGPTTIVVEWSKKTAVAVKRAIKVAKGQTGDVRLVRLPNGHGTTLRLAVTLPRPIFDEAAMAHQRSEERVPLGELVELAIVEGWGTDHDLRKQWEEMGARQVGKQADDLAIPF